MDESRKSAASERREKIRQQFWPDEDPWRGNNDDRGWFKAPRTIPLILTLLSEKEISGAIDPTQVYLELLSRHWDGGIVEMVHEGEHAYASGCTGNRGIRTWQEKMNLLERLGFIKIKAVGNQRYKHVFVVHPTTVVQRLYDEGRVPDKWWDAYCARKIETKERSYVERQEAKKQAAKVVSLVPKYRKAAAKTAGKV